MEPICEALHIGSAATGPPNRLSLALRRTRLARMRAAGAGGLLYGGAVRTAAPRSAAREAGAEFR